jgi:hypothetical protein
MDPSSLLGKPDLSLAASIIASIANVIAGLPELLMQRRGFYSRGAVTIDGRKNSTLSILGMKK